MQPSTIISLVAG